MWFRGSRCCTSYFEFQKLRLSSSPVTSHEKLILCESQNGPFFTCHARLLFFSQRKAENPKLQHTDIIKDELFWKYEANPMRNGWAADCTSYPWHHVIQLFTCVYFITFWTFMFFLFWKHVYPTILSGEDGAQNDFWITIDAAQPDPPSKNRITFGTLCTNLILGVTVSAAFRNTWGSWT